MHHHHPAHIIYFLKKSVVAFPVLERMYSSKAKRGIVWWEEAEAVAQVQDAVASLIPFLPRILEELPNKQNKKEGQT